ncbi:Na+/H+ antiporter NhaA [Brenneria roseae subsp. americana]|uniref:Na(+)/H(+) antiporter NhaA n=1 Tax=Brenneria roseae subsp. americana TaxID=1508507 RepID=A0A2U1U1N2_9GAMM|nr:Na+/H+ antiporter NhaA [Brenneria roseae]PWC15571.1 Na+/H+ antiporter NhaA [Brenneria roseae subsp. americana]
MSTSDVKAKRPASFLRAFLDNNSSGGIVLMIAAAVAIIIANTPLGRSYDVILHTYVGGLSVLHWINDALMVLFFLMVGLEIKREVLDGQLSSWSRRILPGSAALGGMIGPALIFLAFNIGDGGHPNGWAIPSATDIAFALGVLSLLGPRVPISLRVFLTALAIIDDLGAVIIIALFYTSSLSMAALGAAALVIIALVALNHFGVVRLLPYFILGAILWFFILKSGVHATLAGVILALVIPLRPNAARSDDTSSPLLQVEHGLQPWVTFLIVPLFGFANAGVSFADMSLADLAQPVPLGVAFGLFLGKQFGVFLTSFAIIRFGWAQLPTGANWKQLYGVAILCGIGFTMSLFIGLLAFPDAPMLQNELKLGVLLGSVVSGVIGAFLLRAVDPQKAK